MRNLFTSLNGALTLSFAALLIELFRGFIDAMFVWLAQDWMAVLIYCAPLALSCNSMWSTIAAWMGLVIGGLALIALGLQIWRKPASAQAR